MNFNCPHCGKTLVDNRQYSGRLVACRHCGGHIQMPETAAPPLVVTSLAPRIRNRRQTGPINYATAAIAFMLGMCFGGAGVGLLVDQSGQTTASNSTPPARVATVQAQARPANPTPPAKAENSAPPKYVGELDVFSLSLGEVGKIPEAVTLTVSHVSDATTVHVVPSQWQPGAPTGVYSPRNFARAVQTGSTVRGEPVIIRGISTRGLVDGSQLSAGGEFQVIDTESYLTVNGAKRTVFVLRSMP